MSGVLQLFCALTWWLLLVLNFEEAHAGDVSHIRPDRIKAKSFFRSPIIPRLPSCHRFNDTQLTKTTSTKMLLCSLFKDEEGFLAEFVAYYIVHGFDKIILFNHGSIDGFYEELAPWTITGDVEIRNTSTLDDHSIVIRDAEFTQSKYWRTMSMKKALESTCISYGIRYGYDYYASPDLDEYIMPTQANRFGSRATGDVAVVPMGDVMDEVFFEKGYPEWEAEGNAGALKDEDKPKFFIPVLKYNYNAAPHVLEPVDQLTIEAYNQRFATVTKMSFYTNTAKKFVYRLNVFGTHSAAAEVGNETMIQRPADNIIDTGLNYTDIQLYVAQCCHFHGCFDVIRKADKVCNRLRPAMANYYLADVASASHTRQKAKYWLRMNHYARSAEKFALKALTWETANQDNGAYHVSHYMGRTYGWTYDAGALPFSCFVRREINERRNAYITKLRSVRKKVLGDAAGGGGPDLSDSTKQALLSALEAARGGGRSTLFSPANYSNHRDVDVFRATFERDYPLSVDPYAFHRAGRSWLRNPEFGREPPVYMMSELEGLRQRVRGGGTSGSVGEPGGGFGFHVANVTKFHELGVVSAEVGAPLGSGSGYIKERLGELASQERRSAHVATLSDLEAAGMEPFLEYHNFAPEP